MRLKIKILVARSLGETISSIKTVSTFLLLTVLLGCDNKPNLSADNKLYLTAKVWGFLKYYHPTVNNDTINWDHELISMVQKLPAADNKEDLSSLFTQWIDSLGSVPSVEQTAYDSSGAFRENFDLSWFDNEYFTKELADRLRYIEKHRSQKLRYVTKGYVGQVEIIKEPQYTAAQWNDPNIRLVTLFRYWNVVEYFYPYKYLMDKKWDDVLKYAIPRFREVTTETDYHLLIRELAVSLCDSHAFFSTELVRSHAGNKYIPAKFVILNDKAVINGFYDDSLARLADLRLGDVISAVDKIPVSEIYQKNEKYINGSNEAVKKLSYSFRWIFNGATDSVSITYERDGEIQDKFIRRYAYATFKTDNAPPAKWKKISGNIGYVNMEEDVVTEEDLPAMMKELADTKAIIFDFRNYPGFIIDELLHYLNPAPKEFVKFIQPDFTYPGRFKWTEPVRCGSNNPNPYRGKVVILANEETQSRSEYFVMAMQTVEGAITIGRQTSGADGDVVDYTFFDDKTSWITGRGVFYPDGTDTQRKGIAIDIEVPLTLNDIKEGRDAILEKAIETIARF